MFRIRRGLNQALYKYLPDSWIDYYISETRTAYTAKVKIWNSIKLDNINSNRILSEVKNAVDSFRRSNSNVIVKGFGPDITNEYYDILTPKTGENAAAFAEVSPLLFFCSNCKKVHSFKSSGSFLSNPQNRYCKNIHCRSPLKQIKLTYSCSCGWAGPVVSKKCDIHGYEDMVYGKNKSGFSTIICKKCNKSYEFYQICPECNAKLLPKNALDWGQFIPFSMNLIDLVDNKLEVFLNSDTSAPKLVVGFWLNMLSIIELDELSSNRVKKIDNDEIELKINERKLLLESQGIPSEYAYTAAKASVNSEFGYEKTNTVIKNVNSILSNLDDRYLLKIALMILEYQAIITTKFGTKSTLNDAIEVSKKLDTNARPELYHDILRKYGFKNAQASGGVPFVITTYGYARKELNSNMRAFPQERPEKKNIYANKLETEGILFEFDQVRILKWLLKNKFVNDIDMPDFNNDKEVKSWFVNNVNIDLIDTFNPIDFDKSPTTYHVYNLIHSVSHSLIKEASRLCGLDKNSISEYIFPFIPAVFIYCQNSQGYNLGALFNLFQAYFDKWLLSTSSEVEKCIYDPICLDRDKACTGCLYLNEISCSHFNQDLNRRYLVGWYDKINKHRLYGYWEE